MSVLDLKRTKADFLKKKGKSSEYTLRSYENIFRHLEKFCLEKYNSSLENLIQELAVTENCQEQVENFLTSYIDELEAENKTSGSVRGYSCMTKNYLKYRRVKFDKDELDDSLDLKKEVKAEKYAVTKDEIKTLLDHASFHIWPRGKFMLIAMPNLDGSFTCTLFMPFEGEISFESINTEAKAERFFEEYFPDIKEDIANLKNDFFKNPTSAMVTIKCFPWRYDDKIVLIGDSAHAIVPFYGQGMNAGFEDISVLFDKMEEYGDDWDKIFSEYQIARKPNSDAIAELSYRNFVEMSSKTANPKFLLQKKIEKKFAENHPSAWVPLYSRVTFSAHPYAEALKIGDKQEKIMAEVLKIPNIETKWDSVEIEERILELLGEEIPV